ncbi:related to transcriptional activator acu-15 [Moesziomyces antarcticus]|uniref:Related to transcriptional activator acu-15 n=2 Tax=Pseudozyma antarctica TaxID=84753 RepID=A0A5C3FI74_PSEA2|nr:related to transcriptional activator acu-15 [Moesziomyces antarcticus]
MYQPNLYPHSTAPPADAIYHQHMIPTSIYPTAPHMIATPSQSDLPTAFSNPDLSAHAADASIDTTNQDDDGDAGGKRRRVQRACDTCRKKKVRCDGLQPEKGACTNCANYGYECTFIDAARKRAPPRSYVEAIEARIVKMEHLISSLAPGVDFTDRIGKPIRRPDDKGDEATNDTSGAPTSTLTGADTPTVTALTCDTQHPMCGSLSHMLAASHSKSRSSSEPTLADQSDEDSEDDIAFIESRIGAVDLKPQPVVPSTANTFDSINSERIILGEGSKADPSSQSLPSHKFIGKASAMHTLPLLERLSSRNYSELGIHPKGARPEFWAIPTGLLDPPADLDAAMAVFPPSDLADKLIDVFFARPNREYPIVNEAQFRHEYANCPELHKEPDWLAMCFCIFTVASPCVDDLRTRASSDDPLSRGMHWWQAAKTLIYRNSHERKPIRHIQSILLSTLFQLGLPISASASWLLLGAAIRLLLDVGAHRRQAAKKLGLSRLEEETIKRVFWVAYSLDREAASSLGRPIMLQDEDIDVELPVEIDDEYLFNTPEGEPLPKQPSDKPALISGFLCSLRLDEIIGRTLKTVYALQKTKIRFGISSKEWEERLVTEIDSALNNWLDTVPPHLRYDPHEADDEWLIQSSLLYSKYYQCQILVHRPFIPAKKGANESSILNFPSLAICTNAARSISHLTQSLRDRNLHNSTGMSVAFRVVSACTILILVVWGAKRNGGRVSSSATTDLRRSIEVLRSMESVWQFCGKAVDILESIMSSTQTSVTRQASNDQGIKRSRDGSEVVDVKVEGDAPWAQASRPTNSGTSKAASAPGKGHHKAPVKSASPEALGASAQPLAPEARQLPLSTLQLASMTPQSSAEQSPSSATDANPRPTAEAALVDPFGPKTPQPPQRARIPSLSGASGIPAALSFGFLTPSGGNWAPGMEADYLQGPHAQMGYQSMPSITPSIFDNLNLPPSTDEMLPPNVSNLAGMSQFNYGASSNGTNGLGVQGDAYGNFGRYYGGGDNALGASQGPEEARAQTGDVNTPQSDGSNGLASYAFELLQKQSVWNLDDDSLSFLQQCGQQS